MIDMNKPKEHMDFNKSIAYDLDRISYYTGMAIGAPITIPIAVVGISAIYLDNSARYAFYLPSQMLKQLSEIYENMPLVKERRKRESTIIGTTTTQTTPSGKTRKLKIVEIAKYKNRLSQSEALKAAKEHGVRLLTNKEADAILQNDELRKKYKNYFPLWTGTKVEYDGTHCKVTELGKAYNIKMPKEDGWYEQDRFGIPSGNPLGSSNQSARYLWRISSYNGLLSRGYDGFGYGRRCVYACGGLWRCGVIGIRNKQNKIKKKV